MHAPLADAERVFLYRWLPTYAELHNVYDDDCNEGEPNV